jgi:phosphoribosylglycinamide formyltransferase-1
MIRIAIFASGNGTNAENIIKYFDKSTYARVVLVLSNNKNAKVLKRANTLHISTVCFDKHDFLTSNAVGSLLKDQADFIVLAGFLWRIPPDIIEIFPNKIINIHPALLPKYGGKGMYGSRVHEAVKENNEVQTGISIHYVNEKYDEGALIFQQTVPVSSNDTALIIAQKVHQLEYVHFPKVIEETIRKIFDE